MRLLTIIFLFSTNFSFSQTLKLASDQWPPFTDYEGNRAIAMDIVGTALERKGYEVDYSIVEFTDVLTGIKEGAFDGSAALWLTDERAGSVYFSEPFLQNQLILVGRKGSNVKHPGFSDLHGKKVGITDDYAYGEAIENKDVIFVNGESDQKNLDRLLSGQLDYILVDALLIQYLLKYQLSDVESFLEIGHTPIFTKGLHFGMSKTHPNAEVIISAFNEEIRTMAEDGSYHDILELSWIHLDVDGDGHFELVLDGEAGGTEAPVNTYGLFHVPTEHTRYYVDGKIYHSWQDVPQSTKIEIPKVDTPPDPGKGELKLKF